MSTTDVLSAAMEDLIKRLETAEGPSRELDLQLAFATGELKRASGGFDIASVKWAAGGDEIVTRDSKGRSGALDPRLVPRYTASLDAALTLHERKPDTIPSDPRKVCIEALRARVVS